MQLSELKEKALAIRNKYAAASREKTGKDWSNQDVMGGFVTDVGELMEIVMAKEGTRELDNVDEKLRHELADCLYSILILADRYHVDLEDAFISTMDSLEEKLS